MVHWAPLGSAVRGTMHGSSGRQCWASAPPPTPSLMSPYLSDHRTPSAGWSMHWHSSSCCQDLSQLVPPPRHVLRFVVQANATKHLWSWKLSSLRSLPAPLLLLVFLSAQFRTSSHKFSETSSFSSSPPRAPVLKHRYLPRHSSDTDRSSANASPGWNLVR